MSCWTSCYLRRVVDVLQGAPSKSSSALLSMVGDAIAESPSHSIIRHTESLFAGSASNERKYWGFVIFQRALPRVEAADLQMLFTKNFMRTWINHLSHVDRYLHSFAKQIASTCTASRNVCVC